MTVKQLNRDMLIELKERYLAGKREQSGEGISYSELANADKIVSDDTIYKEYDGYTFGVDDFSCSAGQYDLQDKLEGMADMFRVIVLTESGEWKDLLDKWGYPLDYFSASRVVDVLDKWGWQTANGYRLNYRKVDISKEDVA